MSRERSPSAARRDVDMDMEPPSADSKPDAKVVVVTNLTRNVVEAHLQTVFGSYGEISKIDVPLFGKSGQNRGKAALEYADNASARKAVSHMDGGQLDGAILKVELSDLPIRRRSRSPPPRGPRNGKVGGGLRDRSYSRSFSRSPRPFSRSPSRSASRSRSRTRSRSPPPYRRGGPGGGDRFGGGGGGGGRDGGYRGRGGFGRRGGGGPPPRDRGYRPNTHRSRSRSPIRRGGPGAGGYGAPARRRSPSYTRGGDRGADRVPGRGRKASRSRSRSYSVRSSRSRTRSRSFSHSRSRSMSYDSRSSRSKTRSVSRGRGRNRSSSRDDIRDSRSRSPRAL